MYVCIINHYRSGKPFNTCLVKGEEYKVLSGFSCSNNQVGIQEYQVDRDTTDQLSRYCTVTLDKVSV